MIRAALLNDTRPNDHYGCERVVSAIERLGERHGIQFVERVSVLEDWEADPARLERMEQSQLVVINGEGTIHHDRPAGVRLVQAGVHLARRGVPVALINATWYANRPELAEKLSELSLVSLRESRSQRDLLPLLPDARHVADLALNAPVPQPGAADETGQLGFTDCVRADVALALVRMQRRFGGELLNILGNRDRLRDFRYYLQLMRVKSAERPWQIPGKLRAAVALFRASCPDAETFDRRIAGLSLVVTGRFHAAIIALAAQTPILGLDSNTPKIASTLADAGLQSWRMTAPDKVDRALIDRAQRWHDDELETLHAFVSDHRARQDQLFAELASLAR